MNYTGVKHNPPKMILMKITSRERPQILLDTVKEYIRLANDTRNMVWLFSLDQDDLSCFNDGFLKSLFDLFDVSTDGISITKYSNAMRGEIIKGKISIYFGTSLNKIDAVNRDVNNFKSDWDILLNISDDQRPIVKGYDDIIRNAVTPDLDCSLWFTDGQPRVNTQEIITKKYYDRFGYIYHPEFKSLWCDNLATDLAIFQGKCIRSSQQIVKHFHPAWGGAVAFKRDALYDRNDKFWNEDEATYKRLTAEGLDKLIPKT